MPWMSVSHIRKELAYFNYCCWALVSTGSLVSNSVKPFFFLNIPLSSKILCFVTYDNIENLVKISNYGLRNRPNVHSSNKIIIHFQNFNQLVGLVMGLMSSSISFFFYLFFLFYFFLYVDLYRYFCGCYFEVYPRMPDNGELLSDATLFGNFWYFINFAISCFVIACSADLEYPHSYRFMMLIEPKIATLYFWHV